MKKSVRVQIDSVAKGGDGVGRLPDGRVVFVPGVLPGELVSVRLTKVKKAFARGEAEQLLQTSHHRREPQCEYFLKGCGGCQFWHATYDAELELKASAAWDAISRISKREIPRPMIHRAPMESGYRNRVTFHQRVKRGEQYLGFYRAASHDVIDVKKCLISESAINRVRAAVEPFVRKLGDFDLMIETAAPERVLLYFDCSARECSESQWATRMDEILTRVPNVQGIQWQTRANTHVIGDLNVRATRILADPPSENAFVPGGHFRQVNDAVNHQLVSAVAREVNKLECPTVLELFCGAGNISFGLRGQVHQLWGIEGNEAAISTAVYLRDESNIEGFHFLVGNLLEGYEAILPEETPPFDVAILDPPRQGASKVCNELASDEAISTVIYISCDAACLGRDLQVFDEDKWDIQQIAFFDMFPRTAHIETMCVLQRRQ